MSVYQRPECGEQGKKYNSVLPSDIEEAFCPSCRSHWDIGLKSDDDDEHAQVGALLARCGNYRVAEYESGWHAEVYLVGGGMGSSEFAYETQLAAIRAAVEAAEQGVRE